MKIKRFLWAKCNQHKWINKQTNYVSNDGNSKDGLTKNGPMNVESLKSKIFISEY